VKAAEAAKEDAAEVAPPADAPAKAAPQPVQCEIEKAIFDSNAGFADWTEEADWGSSEPAPAEVENEDGWTMKTTKTKTPKKGKAKGKKRTEGSSKPRATAPVVEEPTKETKAIAHANPMQALMASMEEELGIEVARTDDESESEAEAEEKPAPAAAAVPEKKEEEKKQQPLSKKERQEQKKKELDDLDDLLAEFGIDTAATNDTANNAGASKSSKKKKKKKSTGAGEAEAVQAAAPADPAPAAGAAIDIEAAKKALAAKKKGSSGGAKKVSAAQAAAKAASSKGKKKKSGVDYDR